MEEKKFRTLIKNDSKLGEKEYVRGRISGIQEVICNRNNDKNGLANVKTEKGFVITTICTDLQYDAFEKFVESRYPGLCEFNYVK